MKKLMVIINDRLSDIIKKGEIISRYYNPGDLFDEVHLLAINNDHPPTRFLQRTVGKAKLHLHNLPEPNFLKTVLFSLPLLDLWAEPAIKLAQKISPDLIRCHDGLINGYIAKRIKDRLGTPYVISLHGNIDEDIRDNSTLYWRAYWKSMKRIEKTVLLNADVVLPVYKPIIPYLKNMGVKNYEVAYNILNENFRTRKKEYQLHHPIRLINVSRLIEIKNPQNIIRALKLVSDTHLTIVGRGPVETQLRQIATESGLTARVKFIPSLANDQLFKVIINYDIFVIHSQVWELSKVMMEAFLAGMPVIINHRIGKPVPELKTGLALMTVNTPAGYATAIKKLVRSYSLRKRMGDQAYATARKNWAPKITESKYVQIYKRFI